MADLIKTNGEIIKDVDISSLDKIQNHVGGYIEYCPVDKHSFMYVDEEGLLSHRDINPKASDIAGRIIVGDVLLCLNDEVDHE
tara:strand:- start:6 stop:254 length:249 start_codon:yes stop_codon:yes gene_type:complete